MTKPFSEWTVLPHGDLTRVDDNLLTVTGLLHMPPMGEVQRRMTVVRLRDGRLVIYSAIALRKAEMEEIEAFGEPTYLIVPSDIHRMDVRGWKARYPQMKVIAPSGACAKVASIIPVDDTSVEFGDPSVRFVTVPGTAEREAALLVDGATGTTLVLNDLIFNLSNRHGLRGWLGKVFGMTGDEPHMPPIIRMRRVTDRNALKAQLERWASMPKLQRILVSHGQVIAENPSRVLGKIAQDLAA